MKARSVPTSQHRVCLRRQQLLPFLGVCVTSKVRDAACDNSGTRRSARDPRAVHQDQRAPGNDHELLRGGIKVSYGTVDRRSGWIVTATQPADGRRKDIALHQFSAQFPGCAGRMADGTRRRHQLRGRGRNCERGRSVGHSTMLRKLGARSAHAMRAVLVDIRCLYFVFRNPDTPGMHAHCCSCPPMWLRD